MTAKITKRTIVLIAALAASLSAAIAAMGDITPTNTPAPAERPSITVSIAIPEHGGQRAIRPVGRAPHFHVILANVSDQPQRIWREWCSWGYYALSFEAKSQSGKLWVAKKKPRAWSKNYPDYWTLAPHESLVIDVYFSDQATWDGFPQPQGESETFTISAVFEVKPDDASRKYGVWTGRAVSQPAKYAISK
jgi:hypothetical protein